MEKFKEEERSKDGANEDLPSLLTEDLTDEATESGNLSSQETEVMVQGEEGLIGVKEPEESKEERMARLKKRLIELLDEKMVEVGDAMSQRSRRMAMVRLQQKEIADKIALAQAFSRYLADLEENLEENPEEYYCSYDVKSLLSSFKKSKPVPEEVEDTSDSDT